MDLVKIPRTSKFQISNSEKYLSNFRNSDTADTPRRNQLNQLNFCNFLLNYSFYLFVGVMNQMIFCLTADKWPYHTLSPSVPLCLCCWIAVSNHSVSLCVSMFGMCSIIIQLIDDWSVVSLRSFVRLITSLFSLYI